MGEVDVPRDALWRAQTQRAIENFPISGLTLQPRHVQALAHVKAAAATANAALGVVRHEQAQAIVSAADAIVEGAHDGEFPIDVFQTGSGTSSNMNANEVIATLAAQAGVEVHPNDHVNAVAEQQRHLPDQHPRRGDARRRRRPPARARPARDVVRGARPRSSPTR